MCKLSVLVFLLFSLVVSAQSMASWNDTLSRGNIDLVKNYVEQKGADVNQRLQNNLTPLHIAVMNKLYPVVQYLVEKGANVNAKSDFGATPLDVSMQKVDPEIIDYLLLNDAEVTDYFGFLIRVLDARQSDRETIKVIDKIVHKSYPFQESIAKVPVLPMSLAMPAEQHVSIVSWHLSYLLLPYVLISNASWRVVMHVICLGGLTFPVICLGFFFLCIVGLLTVFLVMWRLIKRLFTK